MIRVGLEKFAGKVLGTCDTALLLRWLALGSGSVCSSPRGGRFAAAASRGAKTERWGSDGLPHGHHALPHLKLFNRAGTTPRIG